MKDIKFDKLNGKYIPGYNEIKPTIMNGFNAVKESSKKTLDKLK